MNQVIITRSDSTVQGVKRTTLSSRVTVGENTLALILIILISAVSLLYLVHENESATKGYAIKALDYEYDELLQKNEVWNMRIATAKALRTITSGDTISQMVPAGEVQYITAPAAAPTE